MNIGQMDIDESMFYFCVISSLIASCQDMDDNQLSLRNLTQIILKGSQTFNASYPYLIFYFNNCHWLLRFILLLGKK